MPTYSAKFGGRAGRAKAKTPKASKKSKAKRKDAISDNNGQNDPESQSTSEDVKAKRTGGMGGGTNHKTSRKAHRVASKNRSPDDARHKLPWPPGFVVASGSATDAEDGRPSTRTAADCSDTSSNIRVGPEGREDEPYFFFDAGCNTRAAIDHLATDVVGAASKQFKGKSTPSSLYQQAIQASPTNYGGCICRITLKPNKPWDSDAPNPKSIKEVDPRVWFVLGLSPGFLTCAGSDDEDPDELLSEDMEEAVFALADAVAIDQQVVGVYATLDYTPEIVQRSGQDVGSQLRRLRATCLAAIQEGVPIQCRVLPAPVAGDGGGDDHGDMDVANAPNNDNTNELYKTALRDLVTVLTEMQAKVGTTGALSDSDSGSGGFRVHLASWNGKCEHMLMLLEAFPELHVGMNGSVGFAKSSLAHECAFDVPLNRLLLETDAPKATPPPVVAALGRAAFCHSGLVPFVAAAVAHHKKSMGITAVSVARAAADNTTLLYGRGIAVRAGEAAEEAALAALLATEAAEKAAAAAAEKEADAAAAEERSKALEDKMSSKKKKKKKKKTKGQNIQKEAPVSSDIGASDLDAVDTEFDNIFFAGVSLDTATADDGGSSCD